MQKIATNIQGGFLSVMTDETADVPNKEQVVVCICWIDSSVTVHEDFVGLRPVVRTTADEIVGVIKVRFLCDRD